MPTLEIPGNIVPREVEVHLREKVAIMCGMERWRFPGSQPVSFRKRDVERLHREDYWVCEKSDGIRVIMLILPVMDGQEVYLIDRTENFRNITGLYFPHFRNKAHPLGDTLLDGELVLDKDPRGGPDILKLYVFDCMVCDGQNIMEKTLSSRTGRLMQYVEQPFQGMLKEMPHMAASFPFQVTVKKMRPSYYVSKTVKEDIPNQPHESDGLIYTNVMNRYAIGTDTSLLKWKAPSENSIDFKLELRFPNMNGTEEPDFTAKPVFLLLANHGTRGARGLRESKYEYYDLMEMEDEEWEKMKASGVQVDDRIVEVSWDPAKSRWLFMRFRDDKTDGNHISVIQNIIESITDGVEVDQLLDTADAVRAAWKTRESQPPPTPGTSQLPAPPRRDSRMGNVPAPINYKDEYCYVHPDMKFPEGHIRSSLVYSRWSGPPSVNGVLR
ncbi:mRNA capping enzyme, alpha subunit [Clavulina sp. PMI_390]|nr:mRNA capping enzyme, alpha subunit [Clavulina sp. PMI_390]